MRSALLTTTNCNCVADEIMVKDFGKRLSSIAFRQSPRGEQSGPEISSNGAKRQKTTAEAHKCVNTLKMIDLCKDAVATTLGNMANNNEIPANYSIEIEELSGSDDISYYKGDFT